MLKDQKVNAIQLSSPSPTIESLVKESRGQQYVLAVNAGKEAVEAEFEVPGGVKAGEMHVLFEGRKLPVSGGKFKDRFPAYGVHVYSTSPELPE